MLNSPNRNSQFSIRKFSV
ncbi:YSIRK-type signal peptide-containing protein [Segatella buccae]